MVEKLVELVSDKGKLRSFEIGWAERILCDRSVTTWALPMDSEYEFVGGALRLRPVKETEKQEDEKGSRYGIGRKNGKGKGKGKA